MQALLDTVLRDDSGWVLLGSALVALGASVVLAAVLSVVRARRMLTSKEDALRGRHVDLHVGDRVPAPLGHGLPEPATAESLAAQLEVLDRRIAGLQRQLELRPSPARARTVLQSSRSLQGASEEVESLRRLASRAR